MTEQPETRLARRAFMLAHKANVEDQTKAAARIAALEQALGMAVECLDGVARGDYDGNAAEILATARQTLGGKHD